MSSAKPTHILQALDIPVWVERDGAPADATSNVSLDVVDWSTLESAVAQCRQCPLHEERTQAVLGRGAQQARWMLIGEAPGAEEDRQGEPFVGPAGQLLTRILNSYGLSRDDVYITNVVKCRPPNNRDPKVEEVAACGDYLQQQIAWVKPQLIIALGRIAAQRLLQTDQPLGNMRGQVHALPTEPSIPVWVTYHPAYLLRSPAKKRLAHQDWSQAWQQCAPI